MLRPCSPLPFPRRKGRRSTSACVGQGFKTAGIRAFIFDDVHDPDVADPVKVQKENAVAREAGIVVVDAAKVLAASPDKSRFVCLDGIPMTEPYHRLMAKEWLKLLVGVRTPSLGD